MKSNPFSLFRNLAFCVLSRLSLLSGPDYLYVPRVKLTVGGPKTFMELLVKRFRNAGVHVTRFRFSSAMTALVPIGMDPRFMDEWKTRNEGKVIQRLDGLFYDPEKSIYDVNKNFEAESVYKRYADTVIFQSEYSKKQCEYFLGPLAKHQNSLVICNGTDLGVFKPNPFRESKLGKKIRFVSSGNFRDPEMIIPVLKALDFCIPRYDFEFHVIGPVIDPEWLGEENRNYLKIHGSLDRGSIAKLLAESDIFLFSFLNPNCPNSVIEATASGLPVVAFDSGSMQELCGFNAELLVSVGDEFIHRRSQLMNSSRAFAEKIELCINRYEDFRNHALQNREFYCIDRVAQQYLEALKIN